MARTLSRQQRLAASFFFTKGGGDVGHAGKFVTSLARQLAYNIGALRSRVCEVIEGHGDIASKSLREQWRLLVLDPLKKFDHQSVEARPYVLVVDALDECENAKDVQLIIHLLIEARSLNRLHLRILLTSKPEIDIRHGFTKVPQTEHHHFLLHRIPRDIVDRDILTFLKINLEVIREERCLSASWPTSRDVRCLVEKAAGLFIWAATVCRFIREGNQFARKRLSTVLESDRTTGVAPEAELDNIYAMVLSQALPAEFAHEEKQELCSLLRLILGSLVILFSSLPQNSLACLLHITAEDVDQILSDLHAIIDVPEDRTLPLRLHHPSFREFLLNKERCCDPAFLVDEKEAHWKLLKNCMEIMGSVLKQDICGASSPGVFLDSVEKSRIHQCIPPEIQYACLYWTKHLQNSHIQLCDHDHVHKFLQAHFLHWFEALSWIGKVSEGVRSMIVMKSIASVSVVRIF